jgi:hypothetical protein
MKAKTTVEQVFKTMGELSGGAYLTFDLASIGCLRELLGAVAVYAVGGHAALAAYRADKPEVRLLISQLKR